MPTPRAVPSPRELIEHLDRYVHGQALAKRDLAVAAYNHYLAVARRLADDPAFEDFGQQHILLLGPTGSGKTYLVKKLAKYLGVPVAFTSATSLVETGYAGDNVESVVRNLLAVASYDAFRAERGIVFLDEVDKIRRALGRERDVSGEGVQNGLLTLLDGRIVHVKHGDTTHRIDTSRILFVCTGAFTGLADIVRQRIGAGATRIGFGRADGAPNDDDYQALLEVTLEDLQTFGFIPEFIGRFSTISPLHALGRDALGEILTSTEDSILRKQELLFSLHGIALRFAPGALDAIAELAAALGTGARGLTRVLFRCLDDVDWRLPDLAAENVVEVTITEATVRSGAPAELRHSEPAQATKSAPPLPSTTLRERALEPEVPRMQPAPEVPAAPAPQFTTAAGMSEADLRRRIEAIKQSLDLENASPTALHWMTSFEQQNRDQLPAVLRLVEELAARESNLTEFFLAFVYAQTNDIPAVLHYLDYMRCKAAAEDKKRRR